MTEPNTAPPKSPPNEPPPGNLSPADAEARIEAMLGGGPAKPRARPQTAAQAGEAPEEPEEEQAAGDAPEASGEISDGDTPAAIEEPAEGDEDAGEDVGVDEDVSDDAAVEGDEAQFITVKLDGQDVNVPVKEAADGYLRGRDYTTKTMALAEERRAFEEQANAVLQEREVYSTLLNQMQQSLEQMQPQEPNWQELLRTDVAAYWQTRAVWEEQQREIGTRLQAVQAEQERLAGLQQQDQITRLQSHLDRSRQFLATAIPGWRDEKRAKADKAAIRAYALKSGFSENEINQAYDPRLIVWGHKARLYDELMANQPKPRREGNGPAALRPGTAQALNSRQARVSKAKRRVAQTKSVDDGIAAIEAILGSH